MTRPAELYACLYAKEFPAQALLRLRPEAGATAFAVMEGEPPLQQVCSCNSIARRLGVVCGMTQVEIDTIPGVNVLSRSHAEESATKAALLECAGGFSPRIENQSENMKFACVLDIAGTEKLFGPPAVLAKRLLEQVRKLGIAASVAVSSNFHASLSLAKGMTAPYKVLVVKGMEEGRALAPLPLAVLNIPAHHAETFALWGISTLGELAALPETSLIARMGQEGNRFRKLARGEQPHLFLPVEPPFKLEEHRELDSPVEVLESLLFGVNVMLEQLIVRVINRALALASVTLALSLEGGARHTRTVKPAISSVDKQLWIKLIHLDLEAHPPGAAILAVTLTAEPGSTSKMQLGLFSPQLPEPARLDVTLARIRAIVGEDCVGRAVLRDTHCREGFRVEPFTVPSEKTVKTLRSGYRTAMRQLRPEENITVNLRNGHPESFLFRAKRYGVECAYGPWFASGDWWNAERWSLHQWDLMARAGEERLCCCVFRDLTHDCWLMAGIYD